MCDKRNSFCYVCGLFLDKQHRRELKTNSAVVEAYNLYFERNYSESRWYEPEFICSTCSFTLKKWKSSQSYQDRLPFSSPMVWHHQVIHRPEDCYFCETNVQGQRFKTRNSIQYPNVLTVTKPCPKENEKKPAEVKEVEVDITCADDSSSPSSNDEPFIAGLESKERHFVSNSDMNDIVRDLKLSWRQAEILGSRLKQWNLVENDFKITLARKNTERAIFNNNFEIDGDDENLVYCKDVEKLFQCFDTEHQSTHWRLFIDGSCKSKYFIDFTLEIKENSL